MKKLLKSLSLIGITSLISFSLFSCGSNEDNDGDHDISVVSNFTKGNDDHLKEEDKEIEKVRFHYHRLDDLGSYSRYIGWHLWCWDLSNSGNGSWYEFNYYDDFGVYKDVSIEDVKVSGASSITEMGFIVANGEWTSKDPDGDRSVSLTGTAPGGIKDIYLVSGSENIYEDASSALKTNINSAIVGSESFNTIEVSFNVIGEFSFSEDKLSLLVNDNETKISSITKKSSSSYILNLDSPLDIRDDVKVRYRFSDDYIDTVDVIATTYFNSSEFSSKYTYTKDDLGVSFDDENNVTKTNFKVWAPTSKSIKLNIYRTGDYESDLTPYLEIDMNLKDKGVWETSINEDLDGYYYTLTVTNQKGTNEIVDPYAKSSGINGKRGMIVNFTKLNNSILNWNNDKAINYSSTESSIYEIHVRDMTINPNSGVSEKNRGKFLGLTEENTYYENNGNKVSTGLSHLKELGITHVQIQPFYDYSSVDEKTTSNEMSESNYNWGYDPENYNVLEGSYSTDPNDGYNRIIEFKKMVMALHNNNININMDVVYNHTSKSEDSNLNLLVPYYYYRTDNSGKFYNGSGCGNEIASNRKMVRKFIVDSTKFYTKEYHLSGFRFDLMGLIDNETMIEVYNENKKLNENILVYGEPWDMGNLLSGYDENSLDKQKTLQASLGQSYFAGSGVYVGGFNDTIRNAVKGDNTPSIGYVQGDSTFVNKVIIGIKGLFKDTINSDRNVEPSQVINYVSCHDNYTLYDQLIQTNSRNRIMKDMYLQAESIVFTSLGIPFLQEGEDFMRTKSYIKDGVTLYNGNSYNVGDYINDMDYSLKLENNDIFESFKDLINIRKNNYELRLGSRSEINEKLIFNEADTSTGLISYDIDDIKVIHSLNESNIDFVDINNNKEYYDVIYSNIEILNKSNLSSISLKNNQSVVLKRVN